MPRPPKQPVPIPGLSKRCDCASWVKCDCAWWYKRQSLTLFYQQKGFRIGNRADLIKAVSLMETILGTERGSIGALRQTTIATALKGFIENREKTKQRKTGGLRTSYWASAAMSEFIEDFGARRLLDLHEEPQAIEDWLNDMADEREWEDGTWVRYYQALNAFFNWCRNKSYLKLRLLNPMTAIDKRADSAHRNVRIPLAIEQRLLDGADVVMERAIRGALCLGLRRTEMLLVQLEDIDFDTWMIQLPAANTKGGKTHGQTQEVFIENASLRTVLKSRRAQLGIQPKAFVFGLESGAQMSSFKFNEAWVGLWESIGLARSRRLDEKGNPLGLVWHDLRHEFGYRVAEQVNGNVGAIKDAMRLANYKTAERYIGKNIERTREAFRFQTAQ